MLNFLALAPLVQLVAAKVQFAGVNIAGFDFGCGNTAGIYTASKVQPPLSSQGFADGIGQMNHFVQDDGLNVFRLPVCWQYLVPSLGASLDETNFGIYDQLVRGCLNTGAHCIVDVHNYARWENQVVGQSNGAVTDDQLASLWYQIAARYQSEPNIIFGIMNEPHDLSSDTSLWTTSVQEAVTSIRNAGAASQIILLPGTDFSALGSLASTYGDALGGVTNLDGSVTNLVYDVHQYLDSQYDPPNTGTHTECGKNGVDAIQSLTDYLRSKGRQAFLTETGGGSTDSCYTNLCAELDTLNYQNDVFLGWVGWAAGAFDASYELDETPTYANGVWTDTGIVTNCVAGKFND